MKRLVFDLTKIPFLNRLIGISCLIVEVLNDQNLLKESNLAYWFSSYIQFCSGGHFSKRAEAGSCKTWGTPHGAPYGVHFGAPFILDC